MPDENQELMSVKSETETSPEENAKLSDLLLNAILDSGTDRLDALLPSVTQQCLSRKYPEFSSRNLLTLACVRCEVPASTFRKLLEYALTFPSIDLSEEKWYYWEPIHFAAYNLDLEKLKALLSIETYQKRANVLTVFSETALHVLLEYGKRTEPLNVVLSNGWQKKTCRLIGQESEALVQCAEILIDAGVDVNHNNIWNETAIIIALRYRLIKVITLLLQKRKNIDIDTCREPSTGKTARDILKENEICLELLPNNTVIIDNPKKFLFTALKSNTEEVFLRYNNEDIKDYCEELDGDGVDTTSGNLLQLCLLKGYVSYLEDKAKEDSYSKDIFKSHMLRVFCKKGLVRSVEHLLNNGARVSSRTRMFGGLNTLQVAVKLSYYPFLAVVLGHKSNQVSSQEILDVLRHVSEKSCGTHNYYSRHVLFLLLCKLEAIYDSTEFHYRNIEYHHLEVLNKILKFYLENNKNNDYNENIYQVLRLGASLIVKDADQLSLINYEALDHHLDQCIEDGEVCYNSFITDDDCTTYSEVEALRHLYHDEKKSELLNHPALINFIHSKWVKTKKYFYANIFFYGCFLITVFVYTIHLQQGYVPALLYYTFCLFILVQAVEEVVQMLIYKLKYFRDPLNYVDLVIVFSSLINAFSKNEIAMVVGILSSTLIFLLMLGQIPQFTKYMIIFSSTKYFFEYLMFYSIQFLSFALCFYILMPPEDADASTVLGGVAVKLFDSLFCFIGQYDGDVSHPKQHPIFSRIIVTLFLFCMTIILNNLLVGLIVTDMDLIQKKGKLMRQIKMAKYVVRADGFSRTLKRCPLKCFLIDTNVFRAGKHKYLPLLEDVFDEDDLAWLKRIRENKRRTEQKNTISSLCELVMAQAYAEPQPRHTNNIEHVLQKLAKLEERLRKIRV